MNNSLTKKVINIEMNLSDFIKIFTNIKKI